MRVAALQQLSKTGAHHGEPAPVIDPESEFVAARLVRCECRSCGAHTNAIPATGVSTTCPNCGAIGIVPVEGAGLIRPVPPPGH
jgi:predicted RNA-binding Zn-ribbon protein involved in translation (DUF1610 family)